MVFWLFIWGVTKNLLQRLYSNFLLFSILLKWGLDVAQIFAQKFIVRAVFFQKSVESFGVVVVHGMREFVHDDVVDDAEGHENEFPVEVEIVAV